MHDPGILPPNIEVVTSYFCTTCNTSLEEPSCPKCNELPVTLSVHVSEVMGSKCGIG